MSLRFALIVCLLASGAAPALAQDNNVAPTVDAKPAKPPKPKKECRREQPTGSFMVVTTCHTSEEWAAIDQQNAAAVDQYRSASNHRGGGNP